jgi:hypothetical protein
MVEVNRERKISIPKYKGPAWIIVSVLEYVVALAAIANVATTSYQLGVQCICNYATEVTAQSLIWTFLAGLIHIGGTIALTLHRRITRLSQKDDALSRRFRHRFPKFLSRELTPSLYSVPSEIEEMEEPYLFLFFMGPWSYPACCSSQSKMRSPWLVVIWLQWFVAGLCWCMSLLGYGSLKPTSPGESDGIILIEPRVKTHGTEVDTRAQCLGPWQVSRCFCSTHSMSLVRVNVSV